MNVPQWGDDSATKLVEALTGQLRRLSQEQIALRRSREIEETKMRNRAAIAGLIVLGAVFLTVVGVFSPTHNPLLFGFLFLGTPLLAGGAGGLARNIYDSYRGISYQSKHNTIVIAFLGMLAGLVAALLFV